MSRSSNLGRLTRYRQFESGFLQRGVRCGRLAESRDDTAESKQVSELIQQGEFAKTEAILQALATKEEDDVARAATTQYDLGQVAGFNLDRVSS